MLSLKKSSKAILLAGTVFTSILSSLGVSYAAYKLIRDTSVLCDFAQNCTLSLTPVASDGAPGLGIYRGRAVGAKPELQLSYIDPSKVSGKLELSIDGKPALSVDASVMKLQDEQLNYGDADAVAKLIEAMRNGQKLQLKFAGKVANYSLSGFVGGLIYIDEQQSRAGTVDALQAKGAKSAPPAPDVTLIKDVQQIPEQVRKDFTDEDGVCGTSNGDSFSSGGGFNAKIADGLNLIGMPCGSPGAYNQSYVFYSQSENQVVPISLPTISDAGPSTTDQAWNIDWSQSNKTITAFFKGRGLGDCGIYDVWKATDDGEGKVRFVLVEERSKGDCDGNYAGGPEKWPASWPVSAK
ncbi:hypothetical protein A8A54_07080 [Brucella pseudogrignonensis]|uniref:DUF1176 domain-containing protein n=1 Tax=Brucella pseudogrignonensis TaxID=419475 RepID=UPI0007DA6C2E|nr:DUF1176 domain-containing protein [Brucella pseudogrignonensis]ANG96277.1 hypothetical protein A8A54_07080 [Brucella pseudogrignonensis]